MAGVSSQAAMAQPSCTPSARRVGWWRKGCLLLALAWGGLAQAECRRHAGRRKAVEWWDEHVSSSMPMPLQSLLSPMTSKAINRFTRHLALSDLPSYSSHFCRAAGFLCDLDPAEIQAIPSPAPVRRRHFKLSDMLVGQQAALPPMKYSFPSRHFLPHSMAAQFDISTQNLPQLLHLLNISDASPLSNYMREAESACESQVQEYEDGDCTCTASLEAMVNFIAPKLGPHLDMLQSKGPDVEKMNLTLVNIALKVRPASHAAVVCSDSVFPFTLFKCHVARNVQIMEVTLQSLDSKEEFTVVMQCSEKKTPRGLQALMARSRIRELIKKKVLHPFSLLPKIKKSHQKQNQVKPIAGADEGQGDCQWMNNNELVFVSNEGVGKKRKKKYHPKKFVILP